MFVVNVVGMIIFTAFNYTTAAVLIAIALKKVWTLNISVFVPLVLFSLIPIACEMMQIIYPKVTLICGYAVSTLLLYLVIQNKQIYTDGLTGLGNRRQLNEYLHRRFRYHTETTLSGLMLDLDGLKKINDTRGHLAGDDCIIAVSRIIKMSVYPDMLATRYGGDEFLIVWTGGKHSLNEIRELLDANAKKVNAERKDIDKVSFSVGAFSSTNRLDGGVNTFLKILDEKMYEQKEITRQNKQK